MNKVFNIEMVDKLLLPEYNPLKYFTHLGKEDKEFVLNMILPKMGYDSVKPLTIPIDERNKESYSSQYDIPPMFKGAADIYRAYRIKFPRIVSDVVKVTKDTQEVCIDYRDMINSIPEEFLTDSVYTMISAITEIPFEGTESYIILLNAYSNVFKNLNIYEISPVIKGLRNTFECLKGFIKLKRYEFESDEILKTIENYIEYIYNIDRYLNSNRFTNDKDLLFMMIISIINLYKTASRVYNNKEIIWDSFPMLVIRKYCNNEDMLLTLMDKCWECSESPESLTRSESKSIEKLMDMVDISTKENVNPDTNWLDEYSIREQISYNTLKKLRKKDIIPDLLSKSGIIIDADDISFDITEDLLAFYLTEFNSKYPIVLGDCNNSYNMLYEKRFYRLFMIKNDHNKLYAASCSDRYGSSDIHITLLEFVKNPDYDYIFKY